MNSHDSEQLHLPVLLRSNPLREKFPYCSHLGLDKSVYENHVAWTKMTGFASWPSRMATEDEIKTMLPASAAAPSAVSAGTLDAETDDCKEQVCMYFLGSHQVGLVKRQQLEMDYVGRFADHSTKCTTKQFLMGLEEADGFVLREVFKEGCGSCMVCGGKDSPNRIILCDRCNSEVHLDCLRPSIASVPEGMWMCPICVVEAPLTYQLESKRFKEHLAASSTATNTATSSTANGNGSSSAQKQTRRRLDSEVAGSGGGGSGNGDAATPSQYKRPKPLATAPAVSGSKWSAEEDAVLWNGITNNLSFQEICSKMDRSYSGCVHRHKELLRKNYQAPANILQLVQQHHQNHMQKQLQPRAPAASYSSFVPTASGSGAAAAAGTESKRGNGASKAPTPPLVNSAASADATTSQLSKLLSIAQMPTMQREPVRTCFACQQTGGGEMLACGDALCGKWFHPFCLGSRLPHDLEERWFCPWHHCALCTSTSTTPPALFAKKPVHHSTIAPLSLQGSCELLLDGCNSTSQDGEGAIKFARCIACPLALCDEHLHAPWDSHAVRRVPHPESHFFLCERCGMQPAPLGKSLDSLFSQALHKRGEAYADTLARRPGQQVIASCAAPELAQALLGGDSAIHARPLSCGEVQALVRENRFPTVLEFEKAVGDMCNTLHTVYKWMHPALAQSCRKFHAQVLELVRLNSVELAALEKHWARFPGAGKASSTTPMLRGLAPWETYERVSAVEPSPDELEYGEAGKQDPHQTFAYLFQALESARLVAPVAETAMEPLLTPTQFEIDDLFETHSASLRASLTSQARLRSEVNRVFASYQAGQETILELHKQLAEAKQALALAQQQLPPNNTNQTE